MVRSKYSWVFRKKTYRIQFDMPDGLLSEDSIIVSADFSSYSSLVNLFRNARQYPSLLFIVFTDSDSEFIDVPENLHIVRVMWEGELSRLAAKFFKLQPYKIFPKASQVTWIDANLVLHKGFDPTYLLSGKDIQFFAHNKRQFLWEEVVEIRRRGKDDSKLLDDLFRDQRFDQLALLQGRFLNSKKTEDICSFYDEWWRRVLNGSIRDQISLPIALDSLNKKIDIQVLESSAANEIFDVLQHNRFDVSMPGMSITSKIRALFSKILFLISLAKLRFIKIFKHRG